MLLAAKSSLQPWLFCFLNIRFHSVFLSDLKLETPLSQQPKRLGHRRAFHTTIGSEEISSLISLFTASHRLATPEALGKQANNSVQGNKDLSLVFKMVFYQQGRTPEFWENTC